MAQQAAVIKRQFAFPSRARMRTYVSVVSPTFYAPAAVTLLSTL